MPLFLHGLLEYGIGVLLIASSSLFSIDSNTATVLSVLIGAGVIVLGVMSDMPTGFVRRLPLDSHIVLDCVIAIGLVASPFIFGFSDEGSALAAFLIIGIGYLFLTAVTRYRKPE